jgi:hypothetical protein
MYLYANGCSLTYGSALHDDPVTQVCTNDSYRLRHAWPHRLASLLGADGSWNDGMPSGSNDRIVRTTLEFAARWLNAGLAANALIMIIGWSHPARREFYVDGAFRQMVPTHSYSLRPLNRLVKAYRKTAVSDVEAQSRFAAQVIGLSSFLDAQGIDYRFFHAIQATEIPAELKFVAAPGRLANGKFIEPDRTMLNYLADAAEYLRDRHPSEAGHFSWARRMAHHLPSLGSHTLNVELLESAGLPVVGGYVAPPRLDRKRGDPARLRRLRTEFRVRLAANSDDKFIYS